jgi:hypothetical protein
MVDLNEYVSDEIGVVIKKTDLASVNKLLGPLVSGKDRFLVCQAITLNGEYLFYRVIDTEDNIRFLENLDKTNDIQTLKIKNSKISKVKDLGERYKTIATLITSSPIVDDDETTNLFPLLLKIGEDFENIRRELLIDQG